MCVCVCYILTELQNFQLQQHLKGHTAKPYHTIWKTLPTPLYIQLFIYMSYYCYSC